MKYLALSLYAIAMMIGLVASAGILGGCYGSLNGAVSRDMTRTAEGPQGTATAEVHGRAADAVLSADERVNTTPAFRACLVDRWRQNHNLPPEGAGVSQSVVARQTDAAATQVVDESGRPCTIDDHLMCLCITSDASDPRCASVMQMANMCHLNPRAYYGYGGYGYSGYYGPQYSTPAYVFQNGRYYNSVTGQPVQ